MVTTKVLDPTGYDEVVTTKENEMVDAFSSKIIHARTKTAFTGAVPQGLTVQNAYTEMHNGSKSVTIVVRNSTA